MFFGSGEQSRAFKQTQINGQNKDDICKSYDDDKKFCLNARKVVHEMN